MKNFLEVFGVFWLLLIVCHFTTHFILLTCNSGATPWTFLWDVLFAVVGVVFYMEFRKIKIDIK